jgi:hypothetical protein
MARKNADVASELVPVVEIWSGRQRVSAALAKRLDSLRPTPYVRSRNFLLPITNKRLGRDCWRYEIGPESSSKGSGLKVLARWATKNRSTIKVAEAQGFQCIAYIECLVRHSRFELPLDAGDITAIARAGLELRIVYCVTR